MTTGTDQDTAPDPTEYSQAAFLQEEDLVHLRPAEPQGDLHSHRPPEHRPAGMPLSAGPHREPPLQEYRQVLLQG